MKKRIPFNPKPQISIHHVSVYHPAGVTVVVPLKDLTEFIPSMCNLYRFRWKARKTVDALEKVNRLSMEAMLAWANVTSPYVTLATADQECSQQQQPSDDPHPSEEASGSEDR